MTSHPLAEILDRAARGAFPPPDGSVEILPPPPGPSQAVVAFTAHHLVAAAVSPEEVRARLPDDDLSAPLSAGFLAWLGERLGSPPGSLDVVLASSGREGAAPPDLVVREDAGRHPRVVRAARYREELAVYSDAERRGLVLLGRGLARRWEVSIEVEPRHRGQGLGRELARRSTELVPAGEPLFAQVAPGNAASLRAFLDAGFRPLGAEVLYLKEGR